MKDTVTPYITPYITKYVNNVSCHLMETSQTYESFKFCTVNNKRVILREVSITRQDTLLHETHNYTLYYKSIYTHVRASYVSKIVGLFCKRAL